MIRIFALIITFISNTASAQMTDSAKQDAENLTNQFFDFGVENLTKYGEFYPYGAAMTPDGTFIAVAVETESVNDNPLSQMVIDDLKEAFRDGARTGRFAATALFYDVRITLPETGLMTDAIAVAVDHEDDYSVKLMIPYTLTDGVVTLGAPILQIGENDIFGNGS